MCCSPPSHSIRFRITGLISMTNMGWRSPMPRISRMLWRRSPPRSTDDPTQPYHFAIQQRLRRGKTGERGRLRVDRVRVCGDCSWGWLGGWQIGFGLIFVVRRWSDMMDEFWCSNLFTSVLSMLQIKIKTISSPQKQQNHSRPSKDRALNPGDPFPLHSYSSRPPFLSLSPPF